MENLSLIAAIGKNRELGKDNELIWHIKEDLKFFREYTMNKKIIMGSNTFFSLPKLLPNRTHIVLTRRNLNLPKEVITINSVEQLIEFVRMTEEELVVIGGGKIYESLIPYVNTMLLTEINASFDADVYFPEFDKSLWNSELLGTYTTSEFTYKRVKYKRK